MLVQPFQSQPRGGESISPYIPGITSFAHVVKSSIEHRVAEHTWPDKCLGLDHQGSAQSREREAEQDRGEGDEQLEPPPRLVAVEDTLLGEDVGTQTSQEAEVGQDVDEDVFLFKKSVFSKDCWPPASSTGASLYSPPYLLTL